MQTLRSRTHNQDTGFRRFGRIFSAIAVPFVRIDLPPREQWPTEMPVIWAPNHRSMFDTFLGLIGLYRMGFTAAFFVTERYFRGPITRRLLEAIGAVPVDPAGDGPLQIVATGAELLDGGQNLVIMAEGRLVEPGERTDGIGPLEPGVAVIAKRASAPIQPVAMIGTDVLLPPGHRFPLLRFPRRRLLLVRFGEPVQPTGRSRQIVETLTERLSGLVVETEPVWAAEEAAIASSSRRRR